MSINNYFFHIHYCNSRQASESRVFRNKISRTLQHHELLLITGGKGEFAAAGKRYTAKTGTLFYIPPDMSRSIVMNEQEPLCFMSVHFSYSQVNFNEGKWIIKEGKEILPLSHMQELKESYCIEDLFKKLIDCWNLKLPSYEFVSKTLLQQLLVVIFQNTENHNQHNALSLKVEKVIDYMHQKIENKVTLPELSELVQLSPPYLSRVFKEITGYSVIEFFNKMKIDKAKELMIEGNKKVKAVSQLLGFSDEFYFSRIFKKMEGISPSKYYSKNIHRN